MPRREETPWRCDFCIGPEPETRWSIPPGTPLGIDDSDPTRLLAAGALGSCATCTKLIKAGAIEKLAREMFRQQPVFQNMPEPGRTKVRSAAIRRWRRILPLLSNPRPCVRGEEGADGSITWYDAGELN